MHAELGNNTAGAAIGRLERLADVLDQLSLEECELEATRRQVGHLVRGYLVPRLKNPNGPFVVSVAGPDGAGKSHIANTLAGTAHSPEGLVRPTTTAPVVLVGRNEAATFGELERRLHTATPVISVRHDSGATTEGVVIVDLPPTPGATSTDRMIDLSDIVLVVISPERYADAAAWSLIRRLASTGVLMVLVVNKVMGPRDEVVADFQRRLESEGIEAPVVTVVDHRLAAAPGDKTADLRLHLDRMLGAEPSPVMAAVARRAEWAANSAAELSGPLDSLGHRIVELRAVADAEYAKAADGARDLVSPAGLGPAAAELPWPDLADQLAGVLTRRVGLAASRTAAEWSRIEHGKALLANGGGDLWRHRADAAADARHRLQAWGDGVVDLVEAVMRRPSPRARDVAAVVMRVALGSTEKPKWRIRRRLRANIDEVARAAAAQLAGIAAQIVADDELRFLERLGSGPDPELVAELRSLTQDSFSPAAWLPAGSEPHDA